MRRLTGFLGMALVILMFVAPMVRACFSEEDIRTVEVVLNKPGVVYDGSSLPLPHQETGILGGVAVKLSIFNGTDGVHIRVVLLENGSCPSTLQSEIIIPLVVTDKSLERLYELGWAPVGIVAPGSGSEVFRKGNTTVTMSIVKECTSDSDCATGGCSGEICAPKEEAREIVSPCVYAQWYDCLKLTSCGCVNGTCSWKPNEAFEKCLREHGVDPSKVIRAGSYRVTVNAPTPEEGTRALKEFLSAFNVSSTLNGKYRPPATLVVKEVLQKLIDTGAIKGLTPEDIAQITKVAEWGNAGYNGKIGWYETENGTYAWIPYYESPNATLVRCGWVGPPSYVNASPTEGNGTPGTGYLNPGNGSNVTGGFDNHTVAPNPAIDVPQNEMASTTKTERGYAICGPVSVIGVAVLVGLIRRKK